MTLPARLAPLLLAALLLPVRGVAEPGDEVAAAFAKLRATSYRKRDSIEMPANLPRGVKLPPTVTECAGGRECVISEIEAPGVGKIQTMQIRAGSRSAVKIEAPGLRAKIETARRDLTVSAAKSLLKQIVAAATAMQTGGISTAGWVQEAMRAAATITTTAQARVALDAALRQFDSWQIVLPAEGEEELSDLPDGEASPAAMYGAVEKSPGAQAGTIRYTRHPAMAVAGAAMINVVVIDAATGVPLSEENYLNGKRLMRTEYFDVGVPVRIEIPTCLKRDATTDTGGAQ